MLQKRNGLNAVTLHPKKAGFVAGCKALVLAINGVPPWSKEKCDALYLASDSLNALLISKKAPRHWLRLTTYLIRQCQLSGYLSIEYQKRFRDQ